MDIFEGWFLKTQSFRDSPIGTPSIHQQCLPCALDRTYRSFTIANLDHIAEVLARQKVTPETLLDIGQNHGIMQTRLEKLSHTYRYKEKEGEPSDVNRLEPLQLLRCHLLLEGLQDPRFVAEVGAIIEKNPKDGKTELGGLIRYDPMGRLSLFEVAPQRGAEAQSFVLSVRDQVRIPHIAFFHLHALEEDCTRFAGPSSNVYDKELGKTRSYREVMRKSDMGEAEEEAERVGESHNVVFTKLAGRRFNADYYAAQMGMFYPHHVVVDLGNYDY